MDLGLSGKVALVTGGSRGIGRSIGLALAAEGCNVAITARGRERLEQTVGEIEAVGVKAAGFELDMAQESASAQAVEQTVEALGRLDVLVNNVGGSTGGGTFQAATDDDWAATLDVNLWPAIRASRAALPHMRAQGAGRIIHITSIYGREQGGPPTYNAAKSAMNSLSKTMARELAPEGITVNAVAPGINHLSGRRLGTADAGRSGGDGGVPATGLSDGAASGTPRRSPPWWRSWLRTRRAW